MKTALRKSLFLAAILCGQGLAQEVRTAPATTLAAIPEPARDGIPPEPPAPREKPDFQIEGTQVKLIDVVESPPMPGLPPVGGTMTLRIHSVADPGLPDATSPAGHSNPEPAESDPTEPAGEHSETHFALISATVYDRSRTLLECNPMDGGGQSVTVWSNIDFNHFGGIGTFEATGADGKTRSYNLMMGIGNGDSAQLAGYPEDPQIPALPDGAPAFVIVTENPDPESVRMIEDLHALHRAEGARMAADAAAREQAYEDRKAHLLANPPKPRDVTVHFWKRDNSATPTEGGQP